MDARPKPCASWFAMSYAYKKLTPTHIYVLRLYWSGELSHQEIADQLSLTPQTVSNIVNSEEGKKILDGLRSATLSTLEQAQAELQLITPVLLDSLIKLATSSGDDRVRSTTALRLMEMAGHVPIRRVSLEHDDERELEKYIGKSEEEVKVGLLDEIYGSRKAPDGTILQ
jgi:DNA-binding MarR family transcriptional regulator